MTALLSRESLERDTKKNLLLIGLILESNTPYISNQAMEWLHNSSSRVRRLLEEEVEKNVAPIPPDERR